MKTCYLHLGMPKTGSSSIQSAFAGFETTDLAYAKLRGSNHGPAICFAFSRKPDQLPEIEWRGWNFFKLNHHFTDFKQQFEQSLKPQKSIIFSGEIIVDRLDAEEFGKLVAKLRAHFQRVVAIAYLRPLASLASSQFQQRLKTGQRRFVIPAPDYRKRFEKVLAEFASGDIIWRRFDRVDLHNGDIVADFAHVLGTEVPPRAEISKNESMSAEALGALYAFNRFTAPALPTAMRNRIRDQMQESLRHVGQTKFGLDAKLIEQHIERHRDDIMWMENVCGFDVRGKFSTVPNPIANQRQLLELAASLGDKVDSRI
ncbi:hypothetical protein SAMN04489859_10618 [Paracoccus alcaliphilus]|uniref:Uncharacterized protein n=1 Tax=Paracoccus alcaliphilus TaxID=34002 RepID=A0A1H8NI35_9RHOB|nr:hypothetical protein [Paracoccus alcaliphilus]WCR20913.1 hypothetical protein JHW40_23320 [Paracoccus alcaliphilus]SEO29391.1 hypothetical protein SAMN04489859_10618 [Paracoccus alcaliphilus]